MKFTKLFWDVYQSEDGRPYVLEKTSETNGTMKLAFPGDPDDIQMKAAFVDEAIDYIINGNTRELELIKNLCEIIKDFEGGAEGDVDSLKDILARIRKYRYHIFDDGLYHLPSEPLQDLVRDLIDEAENLIPEEEEPEEELPPTPEPGIV